MEHSKKTILYVDDDEDDIELLSNAIKQIDPDINIDVANNGVEALEYLHSITRLPCLIVLDLNMPYLDGKQTFKKIKDDHLLQHLPVVVYTSSSNPSDKAMFNSLGIHFITKPHNFSAMNSIAAQIIGSCWYHSTIPVCMALLTGNSIAGSFNYPQGITIEKIGENRERKYMSDRK